MYLYSRDLDGCCFTIVPILSDMTEMGMPFVLAAEALLWRAG